MPWTFATLTIASALLVGSAYAAGPVFTDPTQVDEDFSVQGEYAGSVPIDGSEFPIGVQLIARGDGRFDAVAYPGGLPGAGWSGGDSFSGSGKRDSDGVVAIEIVDANGVTRSAEIRGGELAVLGPEGQEIIRLPKTVRESPTLGKAPPVGARVIFDGAGPIDEAETLRNARFSDDGLLMVGTVTAEDYGGAEWHLEFLLPYQPHDSKQHRGNSGAYVAGCYEIQILDSFGGEGKSDECGGLYGAAAPLVNMCLPPLVWQTYDIDFTAATFEKDRKVTNARMTVRHNGTMIHENVDVPAMTPGGPRKTEGPAGPLFLQDHGNPVRFRNIWVKPKM